MRRKIMALLITTLMILTAVPTMVFAEENIADSKESSVTAGENDGIIIDEEKDKKGKEEATEDSGKVAEDNKAMSSSENSRAIQQEEYSIWIGEAGYTTLADAVSEAISGATIKITGDLSEGSEEDGITIANKSLTFVGEGDDKPVIENTFDIAHTDENGSYTVSFENLRFEPTDIDHVINDRSTNATSAENVNQLLVNDCEFYLTVDVGSSTKAVIAIEGSGESGQLVTGTKLTFTGNKVETDSYSNAGGNGYYTAGISTSTAGSSVYGESVYNYGKHVISNNQFLGHLYYAYVGGYADFSGNTVDLKYGSGDIDDFGRALQVRGAKADNHGGQLDLVVTGNTFGNVKEVFKLYALDTLTNVDGCWFEIAGSDGPGANTFKQTDKGSIPSLGSADGTASAFGSTLYMEDLSEKSWKNITSSDLVFKLSQIVLKKQGELSMDKMTLEDGSQVQTYTQVIAPEAGRTGFYIEQDAEKYWYFTTIYPGNVHYLLDDESNVYIVKLSGGGEAEKLNTDTKDTEWPGDTPVSVIVEGNLYKADFSIITDGFDNTYYNSTVSESEDAVILSAAEGQSAENINAFISNIGNHTSLYVTDNTDANVPEGALKLVVPDTAGTKLGQLLVSGAFPVTVDANIENIEIVNKCDVEIEENVDVTKIEISEEAAVGSTMKNDGSVGEIYLLARTELTNSGKIGTLATGEPRPGGVTLRLEKTRLACGSVIHNEGDIQYVNLVARTDLYNGSETNSNASVQRLTVGNVAMKDDSGIPYATDSKVVNYGHMCSEDSRGDAANNINLYVKAYFNNKGTIGKGGRDDNHGTGSCNCQTLGGIIVIGYYNTYTVHDGLVFVNEGTVYTGSRHNGGSHQCFTFLILSNSTGQNVNLQIYNKGEGKMYGPAFIGDGYDPTADNIKHTITDTGKNRNEEGSAYEFILTEKIPTADYSAVDAAIAAIPEDLTIYTDESVKALNDAVAAVEEGLDITEQERVDAMAEAINDAIGALQKKDATEPGEPGTSDPTTDSSQGNQGDKGSTDTDTTKTDGASATGDNSNMTVLFAAAGIALAAIITAVVTRRKKEQ